jgi:DNA segregation ATPase FtsK/SpoIIIE, S-DNA-T family
VFVAGMGLAAVLTLWSLGLTHGEWRTAGRYALLGARASYAGGRTAASALATGTMRMSNASTSVVETLRRIPSMASDPTATVAPRATPDDPPPRPAPPSVVPAIARASRAIPAQRKPVQEPLPLPEPGWKFPPLSLLNPAPVRATSGPSREALEANARLLETVLSDYGVQGTIATFHPGPVVTLYELEPAPGIRSARVIGLADDVARSLSVTAVRIATVPGRNVIGIEVPNAKRETVYLTEILTSDEVQKASGRLTLALGKDIGGKVVVSDLSRMPHLMIAGTTGSGKSVGVNAMILSLLYRLSPDQCRLILIDPKMLELSMYEGVPHLMAPVVTEPAKAVTALKWTVREMERRYRAMSQLGVRNLTGYNDRVAQARAKGEVVTRRVQTGFDPDTNRPTFEDVPLALEHLPLVVVVVDEMADLMMVAGKEIEAAIQRLAQMARAAGIHVIMATQRPSVDVITGVIKANFPTRISFQVISKFDSRTILGEQGAEQLLGMGDMLFMQGGGRIQRVHGPFVSDEEVEKVVAFLREQGEPAYVDDVTEPMEADNSGGPGNDVFGAMLGEPTGEKGLYEQAVSVVAREGKASTSFIQRHLNIGYNRAAKLIEQMEKEGVVGPANHVGKREVLIRRVVDEE